MRAAEVVATPLLLAVMLAGCNDTRDLAPPSPDTPWQFRITAATAPVPLDPVAAAARPTTTRQFVVPRDTAIAWPQELASFDAGQAYSLAELIDIAERRSPTTRVAWELARQAAISVGVARSAYLPTLSAVALGGFQRIASPFPNTLVARGYITANSEEVLPELTTKYLLFDFGGGRAAGVAVARQLSYAANVGFTAAHQALILAVARAYFTLDGVDAAVTAARQSRADAGTLQSASEAAFAHGVGTIVSVDLARRGVAQSDSDLTVARTAQHTAHLALLAALDLPPETPLRVAGTAELPLLPQTGQTVDQLMHEALAQRPDLIADLARVRAANAGVGLARSAMLPKIALDANIQGNIGRIGVDSLPYQSIEQPQAGVFLSFTWPLYAGGLLRNEVSLAESRRAAAADVLAQASETALREVALAYDGVDDGLAQYRAATTLETASATAFDAARDAYANGVGTFTDAATAQTALASARASRAHAHTQALINAAALAYAVGALTSSEATGLPATAP